METQFKRIDPSQYAHAWENVPYADQDPLQVVHIYTPGDTGDYPLLVYVNGGVHGDPRIKTDDITKNVYDFADEVVFGKVRQRPNLPEVRTL